MDSPLLCFEYFYLLRFRNFRARLTDISGYICHYLIRCVIWNKQWQSWTARAEMFMRMRIYFSRLNLGALGARFSKPIGEWSQHDFRMGTNPKMGDLERLLLYLWAEHGSPPAEHGWPPASTSWLPLTGKRNWNSFWLFYKAWINIEYHGEISRKNHKIIWTMSYLLYNHVRENWMQQREIAENECRFSLVHRLWPLSNKPSGVAIQI